MIFEINGFDIVPFLGEEGVKWSWNGIDSPKAGRAMNTLMYRGLLSIKARADIECLWMPKERAIELHQRIMPEYVTVRTDTIPWISGTVTKTMYSNNVSQTLLTEYTDGTKLYADLQFPLIER